MKHLLAAYHYLRHNWEQIQASRTCGCCACVQVFPATEIVAWTGLDLEQMDDPQAVARQTALCPRCGNEAVLGDHTGYPIQTQFLSSMNEAWFQQTIIHRPKAGK